MVQKIPFGPGRVLAGYHLDVVFTNAIMLATGYVAEEFLVQLQHFSAGQTLSNAELPNLTWDKVKKFKWRTEEVILEYVVNICQQGGFKPLRTNTTRYINHMLVRPEVMAASRYYCADCQVRETTVYSKSDYKSVFSQEN